MTVCVAVLCNNGYSVVASSDRMLSTADNQFQREKFRYVTPQVMMMLAGDVALHTELMVEVMALVRVSQDPSDLTVKNVAHAYSILYSKAKLRKAEREYLLPLGLDAQTFVSQQATLSERLVTSLTTELVNCRLPASGALFAGVDSSTGELKAHIYSVDNGVLTCHDDIGFAAIGIGRDHANSSLMFSRHAADITIERAVYLAYASKKRAEVAPGVGMETDMFFAPNNAGQCSTIRTDLLEKLQVIYSNAEKSHTRINENAERKCHDIIQTFGSPPPPKPEPVPEAVDRSPSAAAGDNEAA